MDYSTFCYFLIIRMHLKLNIKIFKIFINENFLIYRFYAHLMQRQKLIRV